MPSRTDISQRFDELEALFNAIEYKDSSMGHDYATDNAAWRQWAIGAASLIESVCGSASVHSKAFQDVYADCRGYKGRLKSLFGVFQAAHDAYDRGLLFDIETETTADVFGSFVVAAKQAMKEQSKDVAAVIASAALEDALKRYAKRHGLGVDGESMATVINALKSKGLVFGAQKSLLDGMLKTRNSAMHADWNKITGPEVSGLIGFVEQFLLTNFSVSHHGK